MAERLDDNPLTAQIPGFSHRKIRLGPIFHTVSLLFATFSRWLAPQRLTGVDADPFQVIFASKHRKKRPRGSSREVAHCRLHRRTEKGSLRQILPFRGSLPFPDRGSRCPGRFRYFSA